MLNKSQIIAIPLDSLVTQTKKFLFFKGKPTYNMEKIEEIDKLINVTDELRKVVSTLFLLQHPHTNFSTTEKGDLDGVPIITTYELRIANDLLIIDITDSAEIKSNGIRNINEYKTAITKSDKKLEEGLSIKVDKLMKVSPKTTKDRAIRTKMKVTSNSRYRSANSYNQYRDDDNFWDYYLMYELFFNSSNDDYYDYEFYDETVYGEDNTLIDFPTQSPEEFYDEPKYYEGNSLGDEEYSETYTSQESSNNSGSDVAMGVAAGAAGVYTVNEFLDKEEDMVTAEENFEVESDTTMAASSFASEMSDNDNESATENDSYSDDNYDDSSDNSDSDDS